MVFTTPLHLLLPLLASLAALAPPASARLELQPLHIPSQPADHHRLARRTIDLSLTFGDSPTSATASASSSASSASASAAIAGVTRAAKNSALLGQYVPSWKTSAASNIDWDYAGLAWWFVLETTSTGFSSSSFSLDEMSTFVAGAHSNNKAALVTVGGWSGGVWFSDLVATSASRESFATLLVDFVDEYGFDGLDIDWEYPGTEGQSGNKVSSADAANYLLFLKALREKLGSRLLTAAMPSAGLTGSDGSYLSDTSAFADVLDFITVMAYDNYGNSYSSTTGPNAPLATCVEDGPSDESQIEGWIKTGFPAAQILLGVPSYSHLFKTASSTLQTTTYNGQSTQSFQALASSQPTDPEYTYAELISQGYLSSDGSEGLGDWVRYFDACTKTPALFNSETNYWISYDDGESSALKAKYAKSMGLAGLGLYDSTGYPAHVLKRVRTALVSGVADEESSAGSTVSTAGKASATASGNYLDSSIYLTHASKTTTVSTSIEAIETATSSADDSASSTAGAAHLSLGLKVSATETASITPSSSGKTTASPSSTTSVHSAASTSSPDKSAPSSTTTRNASSGLVLKALSSSASTTTATDSASASSTQAENRSSPRESTSSSSYSAHAYKAGSVASSSSSSTPAATTSTKEQSGVYTVPDGYEIVADMRIIGQGSSSSFSSPAEASSTGVASLAARSWSSRARGRRGRLAL